MPHEISIADYLGRLHRVPLIDVRSPGEFAKGNLPSARNIPLFTDAERAHVGTVYKQQSREEAISLGYRYVTPKLDWFVESARAAASSGGVAVHCWRGGMRSHSFAQHLESHGLGPVYVVQGGYKAFRNHLIHAFSVPRPIWVLGGYTGSGKTNLLAHLHRRGQQVIDLEGLACHRGSAFGGITGQVQPTPEQFENNLYWCWKELDPQRPVWLEDESYRIGAVNIPLPLYEQMRRSPLVFLDIPRPARAALLVEEYSPYDNDLLADAIRRIARRLGDLDTRRALHALAQHDYHEVALITLGYYDKSYGRVLADRNPALLHTLPLPDTDPMANAGRLLEATALLQPFGNHP